MSPAPVPGDGSQARETGRPLYADGRSTTTAPRSRVLLRGWGVSVFFTTNGACLESPCMHLRSRETARSTC